MELVFAEKYGLELEFFFFFFSTFESPNLMLRVWFTMAATLHVVLICCLARGWASLALLYASTALPRRWAAINPRF